MFTPLPCEVSGEAPVHAFVGLRALQLPSRQYSPHLTASPYSAYSFLPPLFPYHASCLILSLHFDTGKQ